MAKTIQPPPKDIPSQEDLLKMLSLMPTARRTERRDRAIISASFLFGTRADNTASLRMTDIDCVARKVAVDATKVRVKNSKSQTICWFPLGDDFEQIVRDWVKELLKIGARNEDALFSPDCTQTATTYLIRSDGKPIEPWKTDQAIRQAFRKASHSASVPYYTPHSAKHFLARLQDKHCRTVQQRKAWSFNLGHENVQITDSNYAKMTAENRDGIFTNMYSGYFMTDDDKELLLALDEYKLTLGTPEFERARKLHVERLGQ
jgi:site-specific recombinase XerC